MRSSYLVALLVTLSVAGAYWYKSTETICPIPLTYRLGEIDESFGLTTEEAREYVEQAESLWEDSVGRELFVYDETSDFTIDFIFDERQEIADSEEAQRKALDEQRAQNETVLKTVESLQNDYNSFSTTYKTRVAEYDERLADYNAEVSKYNDRGGAPQDVFQELEKERIELSQEVESLTKLAAKINDLATEINRLSDRGNELVNEYNQEVSQYNAEFGFAREFTQGDYQGRAIHIYKFSSSNELATVLAHEFGHALGIDHVEGSSSLMYYLLEETENPPTLSTADLEAYFTVCGTEETREQIVRRTIREFLAKFK